MAVINFQTLSQFHNYNNYKETASNKVQIKFWNMIYLAELVHSLLL